MTTNSSLRPRPIDLIPLEVKDGLRWPSVFHKIYNLNEVIVELQELRCLHCLRLWNESSAVGVWEDPLPKIRDSEKNNRNDDDKNSHGDHNSHGEKLPSC